MPSSGKSYQYLYKRKLCTILCIKHLNHILIQCKSHIYVTTAYVKNMKIVKLHLYYIKMCRAIAQTVRPWLLRTETPVHFRARFVVDGVALEQDFLLVLRFSVLYHRFTLIYDRPKRCAIVLTNQHIQSQVRVFTSDTKFDWLAVKVVLLH
jgi:hypothetical protein